MTVPFLDIKERNTRLKADYMKAIGRVISGGTFTGGPQVEEFEHHFARFCGTRHAVGLGSGTDALWLTLVALGIGPGDEVVTVPMTFPATVEAICLAGAKPVFADIDARTYTMDPSSLERVVTARTKAVVPVHLFGQTADMEPILAIAQSHGAKVVEDAAHAHGAEYHDRRAGSLGDAGCFSFYPTKNLGAFGEAGAVVTDNGDTAARLRMLRDHGRSARHRHKLVGWNSRMDGIQAAVLTLKLRHLHGDNEARRNHADAYHHALDGLPGIITPRTRRGCRHARHIYALRAHDRRSVLWALEAEEIGYNIHYPVPVHLQPAYRHLGHRRGDFPVAERCADEFISLPIYPELTPEQVEHVAATVRDAAGAFVLP